MTSLAYVAENGAMSLLDAQVKPIVNRLKQGRDHRRLHFEGNWQMNLAFASGRHWLGWHDKTRTIRTIQELDPRYRGRELVTADVITEYRTTALGELGSDNDRPELLLRHDDAVSEDYQAQLNRALGYGWEHEWNGDDVLAQVDRFVIDLGTAAVRCRFDPATGPVMADNVPHYQGRPVMNPDDAMALMANGPNPDVQMLPVRQGKICWEPLSPFSIIAPPGATHESLFPWEGVVTAAYLPDVQETYGQAAYGLTEDKDISSTLGIPTNSNTLNPATYLATDAKTHRLRDHIWLISYYERPTQMFPNGRELTFAGNDYKLLDYKETLPYAGPDGVYRSGLTYFHWWRVTGRFWSRALVDVLKDAQRTINKRRTQENEIIDRNMPFVIVQKGSLAKRRVGLVNEMVEVEPGEREPLPVQGTGPGPWITASVESAREDLQHASGIGGPRRGENPQNVTTYSQLALINELDTAKREPIYLDRKRGIKSLVEDSIYDMRLYWGPQKQIALAGENNTLEAQAFNATQIPPFFIVEVGKGSAKPRSQAAELQKITDIWNAAVVSTAVQQNPNAWVQWYYESITAGEALNLPASQAENPAEKAQYENHYMQQGVPMPIAYYDVHAVHLPEHRKAQDAALFRQDTATWQVIENHCQLHMNAAQAQAQAQLNMQAQQHALAGASAPQTPGGTK